MLATVMRLQGDLGQAEEIVQEAWVRAITARPSAHDPYPRHLLAL